MEFMSLPDVNSIPCKDTVELPDVLFGVFTRKGRLKSLHYDYQLAKNNGKPSDVVRTLCIGAHGIKGDPKVSTK